MRKLIVDSTGAVVPATRFVAQAPPERNRTPISPLNRLEKFLKGEEKPRVQIVRGLGGIGDVLMMTPAIRAIKEKYNVEIDFATNPEYLNGALVKVLAANKDISNIIDFRTSNVSGYMATINFGTSSSACPAAIYETRGCLPINRIDLFARAAGLALPLIDPSINYEVLPNEREWAMEWLVRRKLDKYKIILVNANSSSRRRDMPQRVLQQAIMKLVSKYKKTMRVVVVLHDDNKTPDVNWNLAGVTVLLNHSVREIAALVEASELVICPDSAILHLASALHKKTVALFGPTDPRARINYHPEAVAIWPGQELFCKQCWFNACHNGYVCWKKITDDMIVRASVAVLEGKYLGEPNIYVNFGSLTDNIKTLPHQPFEVL